MTSLIQRGLAAVGMAPARQVERVTAQFQHAAERLTQVEDRLAAARADAEGWKRRYEDSSRQSAEHQAAAARAEKRAERADAEAAHWKERAQILAAEVRELKERLREAQRVTATAREHLMATETKLDLIEAAIQVLDTRTRNRAVSRS
jgi:chromosome segregation ATPase